MAKRALVIVAGTIERQLRIYLPKPPNPRQDNRADALEWLVAGPGLELAQNLVRLRLATGILARTGSGDDDRRVLAELRRQGVLTGAIQRSRQERTRLRIVTSAPDYRTQISPPFASRPIDVARARRSLSGIRHLHVCVGSLHDPAAWTPLLELMAHARKLGATTSTELDERAVLTGTEDLKELMRQASVVFSPAGALRLASGVARLREASSQVISEGVDVVVARLGAGGTRVYHEGEAVRVPCFGAPALSASSRHIGAFLLGWLQGAPPAVCVVYGAAAELHGKDPVDRWTLRARLRRAKSNPGLSKLVAVLRQGETLLSGTRRLPRRR